MPMESLLPTGYAPNLRHFTTLSSENVLQSSSNLQGGNRTMLPTNSSLRAPRSPISNTERVKHYIPRSRCYTCKRRHVKCDNTYPICKRCRKTNKECVYPSASCSSRNSAKTKGILFKSNPSHDDGGAEDKAPSHPIPNENGTPSLTQGRSISPSNACSSIIAHPQPWPMPSRASRRSNLRKSSMDCTWAELPPDVRFYLEWFRNNITCHHYCLKHDGVDFMRTTLLEIAVHNDYLLYAIVGFAAYHYALTRPDGHISDYLKYYNRSIQFLRLFLQSNQRQTPATILTMLQLATIEEYLGDWANLLAHQKAAYETITSTYTPQTIMQNETLRKMVTWYLRFELMLGTVSGCEIVLSRDWFVAYADYYTQQARDKPYDVGCKFEEGFSLCRLFARDSSTLFARRLQGRISDRGFVGECMTLGKRMEGWYEQIDRSLEDSSKHVTKLDDAPLQGPKDIVDPYDQNFLYVGDVFPMNIVLLEFWAIAFMLKVQLYNVIRQPLPAELDHMAYKICQMFEALELHQHSPNGIIIEASAALATGLMHMRRDNKHIMWGRRKFAKIEAAGYIFPQSLRNRMAEAWEVDVSQWWLPNKDGRPPILQQARNFVEERSSIPATTPSKASTT